MNCENTEYTAMVKAHSEIDNVLNALYHAKHHVSSIQGKAIYCKMEIDLHYMLTMISEHQNSI